MTRHLRALPTMHDLPPAWDGQRVTWSAWVDEPTSLRFHRTPDACSGCGARSEPLIATGRRQPMPGATFDVEQTRPDGTIRRRTVPAWPINDLFAYRCRTCGHDVIHDERADAWWDLDPADYGDDGSFSDGLW